MAGQRKYSHIARTYDILDLPFEYLRYRPLRPTIWSGLDECCRILDAGIGTGRNMDYYPAGVEMVGLDLSPAMLARAAVRRRKTGTAVHLVEGNIIATPFADDTFDAVRARYGENGLLELTAVMSVYMMNASILRVMDHQAPADARHLSPR